MAISCASPEKKSYSLCSLLSLSMLGEMMPVSWKISVAHSQKRERERERDRERERERERDREREYSLWNLWSKTSISSNNMELYATIQ
jgi:hypothetical protein